MLRTALALSIGLLSVLAHGQALQLVSRATDGGFPNGTSLCYGTSVSEDGRYVVFESNASNLVAEDTNKVTDVFLRDVRKGTTERLSVGPNGVQGNGASMRPSISSDGHYVVFWSYASNFVDGDTNGKWDVYLRDLRKGTTERVSISATGEQSAGEEDPEVPPSISRNGQCVVWASQVSDLVEGDTNNSWDVFLRDRVKAMTELVSCSAKGEIGNGSSIQPFICDDGSYIAFRSAANNLMPGDENKSWDIFVRDRVRKSYQCATLTYSGAFGEPNHDGPGNFPASMSADGRYITFESYATDLVPNDTNGKRDIFVRDLRSGTVIRASAGLGGGQANGDSAYPTISADGRWMAFESHASNLVAGDVNQRPDVFLCDLRSGQVLLASLDPNGVQGNQSSLTTRISGDGRWLVFRSESTNLLPGDRNGQSDVFILELGRR